MACKNFLKAERAAKSVGIAKENYTIMHLDLSSLEIIRKFADSFKRLERPLDALVCNAAIYLLTAKDPTYTAEGFEVSIGMNHLGHFLLSRLLLDDMKESDYPFKRFIIVGSITDILSEKRSMEVATQSQELLRTLHRYYSNAYMDAKKQDAINVVVLIVLFSNFLEKILVNSLVLRSQEDYFYDLP